VSLDDLRYRLREPVAEPEGALVLFHGRGADEDDLYPLLDALDPERRRVGVTPRGPLSLPPGGAHWYALGGIPTPDPSTFHRTRELVARWLDAFADEHGTPPERTILGGFSQGAVLTYTLGLGRGRPRPEALLTFSGFVPVVEGFELDLAAPLPPVAIGHGTYDDIIPAEFSRSARRLLEDAGADVLYREYPLPHALDPRFVVEVREWLGRLSASRDRAPGSGSSR
jgi:phospholipase/carboxylesterase